MNADDPADASAPELPPALREWLAEQPARERRELERTWGLAGHAEADAPGPEATGAAWNDVAAALDAPAPAESPPPGRPPPARPRAGDRASTRHRTASRIASSSRARRWAAALAVVVLLAGAGLWLRLRPVAVTAPAGATQAAALPDGSRAVLNSASTLTYRRGLFGWDRRVELEGEAFFDVEKGDAPFTVTTLNARAEVLGTRFDVRARPAAAPAAADPPTAAPHATATTTVTLASGALRLSGEGDPRQSVTLAPGQESRVAGRGGVPSAPAPADVKAALAWRSGGLAFSNAPLGAILDEVERRFAVEIRATPALRRDSLSLYLPGASGLDAVLSSLCAAQGCRYHRTGGGAYAVTSTR